jgi:hypothetical protein
MKQNRAALKIASVRTEIGLLQAEERRLHEVLDSTLTATEIRIKAKIQLNETLKKLMDRFSEITRLESKQ